MVRTSLPLFTLAALVSFHFFASGCLPEVVVNAIDSIELFVPVCAVDDDDRDVYTACLSYFFLLITSLDLLVVH